MALGQHNRALFPSIGKTNFSTTFCSELNLGVFMKVVDIDVIFQVDLEGLLLDF
ncbi:hypothetical protein MTR_1g070525 [Medicago truncatula]|uniref:Uncharacterized protein n=1 Tax=Medicago truncatula TaxID=3880 RepID=A0A072VLW0_MEDTR|nr:hypothetical protein MTR_1g070525 [Medicago truncatula]